MEEYICENPICENFNQQISEDDVLQSETGKLCPKCYNPIIIKGPKPNIFDLIKKNIRKIVLFFLLILLIAVVIFLLSGLKKNQPDKNVISEKKIEKVNTKIDTVSPSTTEINTQEEKVQKENPKNEVSTKKVEKKQSNYTINFSYGYYKGETLNGKMHGYGTLYFNQQQTISSKDPKNRVAEQGDYISGTWYNGFLDQGKWYSKNGEQKGHIIIGH